MSPRLSAISAFVTVAIVMLVSLALNTPAETNAAVPAAPAALLTFDATEDSWIDEAQPDQNNGADLALDVGLTTDQKLYYDNWAPVQFDLSELPAGVEVISGTLELYQIRASGPESYTIWPYVVSTAWDETTVTWNNQPRAYDSGAPATSVDLSVGPKRWDVTDIVRGWASGDIPNEGIMLVGDSETLGSRHFNARENSQLPPPRLIISYTGQNLPTPTRTPVATWTPIPTNTPTPGPTPTATPMLAAIPYTPPVVIDWRLFEPDLSIYGIEITQGIQCFDNSKGVTGCSDNSLPVVTKKDSTARIYLKYSGLLSSVSNVPVRLHIYANGVWYTANTTGKATKTLDQGANNDARVYFNVNFSNDVPVSFYAVVDPDNTISETNESNNRYPASGTITLNFRRTDTLKIVGQRLRYHPSGYSGTQYAGGWAVNGGAADWFEQVLPIRNNGVNYSVKSGYLDWTTTLNSDGQHALIKTLNWMWILENVFGWLFGSGDFTGADHVYGWAPNAGYSGGHADMPVYPHAGGLGVVGIGTDAPGTSTDSPGAGALIFGHELVHDYDIFHTDTADACGSSDGNSDFPYSSSSIQEFGFNPITGKIYTPSTTHDLMSYCPSGGSKQGWISPFTWNKMFNEYDVAAAAASLTGPRDKVFLAPQNHESLAVNATIDNPDVPGGENKLGDLYHVGTGVVYTLPDGPYAVQLRNGAGTVLASETFTVSFKSEYSAHGDEPGDPAPTSQADVSFIMPWVEGATSVVLLRDDQVLDQRDVSANAPAVTITGPSGATDWPAGTTQTLTWDGSDVDGDSLSYSVFYSYDAGLNWQLLASELTSESLSLDVDSLAGGSDVRFRVVATDGVNTAYDETDGAISVPNKAPLVTITEPSAGRIVAPGALLVLQGTATDMEDGGLPDSALEWSSDHQGGLGIGPSVALNTLDPGEHIVTLTARDSLGVTASASVRVFVGYGVNLPMIVKP